MWRSTGALFVTLATLVSAPSAQAADSNAAPQHRVVFQVDDNDLDRMNLTLNNVTNVIDAYRDKHEDLELDVVAYGPGLHMLRADTSKVADRIAHLADYAYPAHLQFSACNNTKEGMERKEGHPIQLLPAATLVPSGVVRIVELQEQGWSYVKP